MLFHDDEVVVDFVCSNPFVLEHDVLIGVDEEVGICDETL